MSLCQWVLCSRVNRRESVLPNAHRQLIFELPLAHYCGYLIWNDMAAPFVLADPDFETKELRRTRDEIYEQAGGLFGLLQRSSRQRPSVVSLGRRWPPLSAREGTRRCELPAPPQRHQGRHADYRVTCGGELSAAVRRLVSGRS